MKTFLSLFLIAAVALGGCRGRDPGGAALETGARLLEQGRNENGLRHVNTAIERLQDDKQKAIAHNYAGVAHWRLGGIETAGLAFDTSMDLDPSLAAPVYNKAVLMADGGDASAAIELFEKAASLDPGDTRALEYLAQVHLRGGKPKQALAALEKALARSPRSPRIITALAVLNLEAGDAQKGIAGFQQALENDAGYLPAIYNLGVVNERWLKDNEQALVYFKEHAALASRREDAALSAMKIKDIEAEILLVKIRESPPAPVQGGEHYTKPETAPKPEGAAKPEAAPKEVSAAAPVRTAVKAEPAEVKPAAKPVASVSAYDERVNTAELLERQGRLEAAVYNYLQGSVLAEKAGETSRAEKALRAAERAADNNARAHHALGSHLLERQRKDEAVKQFKMAAELEPSWPLPCLALAGLLAEMGENDAAVVCLKQADRARPDEPEALWQLARIYDGQVKSAALAAQCYSAFAKRFPGDPRAEKALARLKELE